MAAAVTVEVNRALLHPDPRLPLLRAHLHPALLLRGPLLLSHHLHHVIEEIVTRIEVVLIRILVLVEVARRVAGRKAAALPGIEAVLAAVAVGTREEAAKAADSEEIVAVLVAEVHKLDLAVIEAVPHPVAQLEAEVIAA